jgi:hypothetical protein
MAWVESHSLSFSARHDEADEADAARVLEQLEAARNHLRTLLPGTTGDVGVVLHGRPALLALARPSVPLVQLATAPAGRRYVAGWAGAAELHLLAPRVLARRASNSAGSLEALMLTPSALYARLCVGRIAPGLPPGAGLRGWRRWPAWAWLAEGAAQWLAGQTRHLRPAVARRLREGRAPSFPPSMRDAALLGGTVLDLVAEQRGGAAAVRLATHGPEPRGARATAAAAVGAPAPEAEAMWRVHLARLAAP